MMKPGTLGYQEIRTQNIRESGNEYPVAVAQLVSVALNVKRRLRRNRKTIDETSSSTG